MIGLCEQAAGTSSMSPDGWHSVLLVLCIPAGTALLLVYHIHKVKRGRDEVTKRAAAHKIMLALRASRAGSAHRLAKKQHQQLQSTAEHATTLLAREVAARKIQVMMRMHLLRRHGLYGVRVDSREQLLCLALFGRAEMGDLHLQSHQKEILSSATRCTSVYAGLVPLLQTYNPTLSMMAQLVQETTFIAAQAQQRVAAADLQAASAWKSLNLQIGKAAIKGAARTFGVPFKPLQYLLDCIGTTPTKPSLNFAPNTTLPRPPGTFFSTANYVIEVFKNKLGQTLQRAVTVDVRNGGTASRLVGKAAATASHVQDAAVSIFDATLNFVDVVRDTKNIFRAARKVYDARNQQALARQESQAATRQMQMAQQQQANFTQVQQMSTLAASAVLGAVFPAIDNFRAYVDGQMSGWAYSWHVTKGCMIGYGASRLCIQFPSCGYAMLGVAWVGSVAGAAMEWWSGDIDGLACLTCLGTHTGVLAGQIVSAAGSACAGGQIGMRLGGLLGFGIGSFVGAVLGGILGKFLADHVTECLQRWKEARSRKQKVDLVHRILGLPRGFDGELLTKRYKQILVQNEQSILRKKSDVKALRGLLGIVSGNGLHYLVTQGSYTMSNKSVLSAGRVLLRVTLANGQPLAQQHSSMDNAQSMKKQLERLDESYLPIILTFSGEYMHPDKVPEPFREVQKMKVLELQFCMEIARSILEHEDWEVVSEETIRQRHDPHLVQKRLRSLLDQAQNAKKIDDASLSHLRSYADCKVEQVPESLCYITRKLGGKSFSPETISLALFASSALGKPV